MRHIYVKRPIDLSRLDRAPQLRAVFDRYQLELMTRTLDSYSLAMVREFYASYRANVVHPMCKHSGLRKFIRQPQLEHMLVRGVRVDISTTTIHRVICSPDYVTSASITECNHILRIAHNQYIMWKVDHQCERFNIDRWIASYILPLGDATSWIEGYIVIKKGLLTFEAKF